MGIFDAWDESEEGEVCGECHGTGMTECPFEYGGRHPENCPACGGEQRIVCPDCDGTGRRP